MSLNSTILSLGAIDLQVTRTAQGTRTLGRYTPGPPRTFTISAGVEPIAGRELKDVPEGRRGDEILKLYVDVDLVAERPGSPGIDPDTVAYTGSDPDLVALLGAGEPWTVIAVSTWTGLGEVHREAKIARPPSPVGVVP